MSDSKNGLPIDPKELVPAVGGFVLGFRIIAFFVLLYGYRRVSAPRSAS